MALAHPLTIICWPDEEDPTNLKDKVFDRMTYHLTIYEGKLDIHVLIPPSLKDRFRPEYD